MGVENNEVVIATTWDEKLVDVVRKFISSLPKPEAFTHDSFSQLFCIIPSVVNEKYTVVLGPDGSKKGWDTAEAGAMLRDSFIALIKSHAYDDGSSPWDWVEVGYGEFGQKVLRGNCENLYDDREYCE